MNIHTKKEENSKHRANDALNKDSTLNSFLEYIGFGKFGLMITIIHGFLHFFQGLELTLDALISPILQEEWKLISIEKSVLSSGIFIGMSIGCIVMGSFGDRYGRKVILIAGMSIACYFALLSVFSNNFVWFFIMRAFVGLGLGSMSNSLPYLVELLGLQYRSRAQMFCGVMFTLGNTFAAFMAHLIANKYGWRIYFLAITVPFPFSIALTFWLPESIRYMENSGNGRSILEILQFMAKMNGRKYEGNVQVSCSSSLHKINTFSIIIKYFLSSQIKAVTILSGAGVCLFSIIFLGTEIYGKKNSNSHHAEDNIALTDNEFYSYFLTTFGDGLGILFAIAIVNSANRRTISIVLFLLQLTFFASMNLNIPQDVFEILLFIVRGVTHANVELAWVNATESFPSIVRSTSVGITNAFYRIILIFVPFIIQSLMHFSLALTSGLYMFICIIGIIAVILMPSEPMELCLDDMKF